MAVVKIPRIIELARQLEADIHTRGLSPGDPYLNAAEAARMLEVSTSTANRALQVLGQRKIVERGQRRGTFVSDVSEEASLSTIRRVQVVYFEYTGERGMEISDDMLIGLQKELPYALIQFNFVPATDDRRHFEHLLDEAIESNQPVGVVLIRAPFYAQRKLAGAMRESEISGVVHGNSYPSTDIPWVNADFVAMADQLVARWQKGGFKRITYIGPERGLLPGDMLLLDRLRAGLAEQKAGIDALRWVSSPPDEAVMSALLADELKAAASETLFYCVLEAQAKALAGVLGPDRASQSLIYQFMAQGESQPSYSTFKLEIGDDSTGEIIGRVLADQARGEIIAPDSRIGAIQPCLELASEANS